MHTITLKVVVIIRIITDEFTKTQFCKLVCSMIELSYKFTCHIVITVSFFIFFLVFLFK